jgi:hypothetical protein
MVRHQVGSLCDALVTQNAGIRVRAAVAARALGVVASDLQDTHADEIAQGDSDLPPLSM